MDSLDDLIHKHFILNNADIFRPYFFKYCNLIYNREYPYNTDNVRKMLECIFNDIQLSSNICFFQNKEDDCYLFYISHNELGFKEHLIRYLYKLLCQ